jgi:hypothetical protein
MFPGGRAPTEGIAVTDDTPGSDGKQQDPRVERLRPDPSQPAQRVRTLSGLWGDSDRVGFGRLYLTSALDTYAEFRLDDVIATAEIPADESPFLGEQATRLELRDEAVVDFTRSRRLDDVDDFDLDVRFGSPTAAAPWWDPRVVPPNHTRDAFLCKTFAGIVDPCPTDVVPRTRQTVTCDTCPVTWCDTCYTCPGEVTCPGR